MKISQTIITAVCLLSLGIGSSSAEVNQFLLLDRSNKDMFEKQLPKDRDQDVIPWTDLSEKQPPKERRQGASRGDICIISPGILGSSQPEYIWTTKPLFIWQKDPQITGSEIVLYDAELENPIWRRSLSDFSENNPIINYTGESLKPGETYSWIILDETQQPLIKINFQVISNSERKAIESDLKAIENSKKSPEMIAYLKTQYFINKNMWADALQEAFNVANPSENLLSFREKVTQQFCNEN